MPLAPPAVVEPPAGARRLPERPWVVLLVDDEADVLTSIAELIEHFFENVRVVRAGSGRAALKALSSERVDVIISDFRMPGMDGIEFLYLARKLYPTLPRVMLTAFADEDLARRAVSEAFVDQFISKAVAPPQFLDRLGTLFEYRPGPMVSP